MGLELLDPRCFPGAKASCRSGTAGRNAARLRKGDNAMDKEKTKTDTERKKPKTPQQPQPTRPPNKTPGGEKI